MIASAVKVNVPTAMPSKNVTKLELYPSVTHTYSRGIPVYRKTNICQVLDTWYYEISCAKKTTVMLHQSCIPM